MSVLDWVKQPYNLVGLLLLALSLAILAWGVSGLR